MQIGRFWGFTAPMLLLASPDKEKLKESFNLLNTSMNRKILQDLKGELHMLEKIGDLLEADCSFPEDSVLLTSGWHFKNGQFLSGGTHSELQQIQAENDIMLVLTEMIIKGELRGRLVAIPGSGNLKDRLADTVSAGLQGQSFQSDGLRAAVRRIYKELPQGTTVVGMDLARELSIPLKVPDKVICEGQEFSLSEVEGTIFKYFADRIPEIKEIGMMANVDTMHEEQIFGISFFHLVNRKPESLLYMVLNQFDHVKASRQAASVIKNVIADVDENIRIFKECFNKYVETYTSTASRENMLAYSTFTEIISGFEAQKKAFFQELLSKGFNCKDCLISDVYVLSWLYDLAEGLNSQGLCKKFGLDSVDDALLEGMCHFGICGLNLYQTELLCDAINCIPLTTGDRLSKSQEEIEEINRVLGLIDSLLDSLLPIGAEL